ncbi:hypothetical protein AvCA_18970 [Azotobacter vinelandii CA]|uniref:Uncharacterized protein n=2 Tax=Azotobacter vinelandii TaxID=354 RepID=C1DEC4_AZOVD|nr:hypothetical protein [Azotobacter vinelandii]ACO78109.1 hypothetical protein Avin_18970 [Azotobacter vinelandii DJ]AGK16855.1 hypothetical protein AvCA_18970 [Azotobacter vinelandii CA]AGK20261.1 hypothetical protein AvCA6_18970 [Azotobacter vinelandii CA6]WKN23821.1 hypothetical protein AVAEIV_001936 [Azotobacter vinelandii]SFY00775.1 hypothetical protein SAMN04244547_03586 [Azotobacter vinelandii]
MSPPRRSALEMRKELVRLRMEMQRQQLDYHAEPLRHPLRQFGNLFAPDRARPGRSTPLAVGAALLLTLFGKRLGRLRTMALFALEVYPLVSAGLRQYRATRPPKPPQKSQA